MRRLPLHPWTLGTSHLPEDLPARSRTSDGKRITLCRDCHRQIHQGFNGRPDLRDPMDAQGGEKLPHMERLYCILDQDAVERGLPNSAATTAVAAGVRARRSGRRGVDQSHLITDAPEEDED